MTAGGSVLIGFSFLKIQEIVRMGGFLFSFLLILSVFLLSCIWRLLDSIWWRPMKLTTYFKDQGITGPPYRLIHGNLNESARLMKEAWSKPMNLSNQIVPRVLPFFHQTLKSYGKMSVTWLGTTPRVSIMDPELIREILSNKLGHFEKPKTNPLAKYLATGLAIYDGEKWAKHRRIINPAFHHEKLKRMLPAFSASCSELISRWEKSVSSEGSFTLDVWPELQNLTGDVISRTAFGSSFEEGMQIFKLQTEQGELMMQAVRSVYIPGYRFLPTKKNIRRKEIDKQVCDLLRGIIQKREKEMKMGNTGNDDLLGLLMESNFKDSQEQGKPSKVQMTIDEVIEECKLFYIAGQETTSVLLAWTMVLLSMHPMWQVRAREEVLQVFGKNKPDFDGINCLKIVNMILHEVLRLYPPVVMLSRRTYKKIRIGGIDLPPGVVVTLPTLLIHHDPDLWGEVADEFNPERFSEGVSKATKNQVSYLPFGWGPRICIGQIFALIEAKLALAKILQHFSFELSPTYAHAPYIVATLQPQHGVQIILNKL